MDLQFGLGLHSEDDSEDQTDSEDIDGVRFPRYSAQGRSSMPKATSLQAHAVRQGLQAAASAPSPSAMPLSRPPKPPPRPAATNTTGLPHSSAHKQAQQKPEDALQCRLQHFSSRIGTFKMGPLLSHLHASQRERRVK